MPSAAKRRRQKGGNNNSRPDKSARNSPEPVEQYDGTASHEPSSVRGRQQPAPKFPGVASAGTLSPGSQRVQSPSSRGTTGTRPLHPGSDPYDAQETPEMDLPFFFNSEYFKSIHLVKRPGFNTTGKEILVSVNSYPIVQYPNKTIYQYDVLVGNGAEKRVVVDKVWKSKARKEKLKGSWIFDGSKLAWSLTPLRQELNLMVDLDAEQGRSDPARPNVFRLFIRQTKKINLAILEEFLRGTIPFREDAQEAFNFLDHLLRETPSKTFIPIKRSFFSEDNPKQDLGNGVFAYKGIYQAIRAVHPGRLAVNVDVSNSCFWARWTLMGLAIGFMDLRDVQQLMHYTKPVVDSFGGHQPSKQFMLLDRMRKLVVQANYRGNPHPDKEWTIKEFLLPNSKQYTFEMKDHGTGKKRKITLYDYFVEKYDIRLDYWQLPVVQMTKGNVVYPMELLAVHRAQKYPYKLGEFQTSSMIKFAASKPAERRQAIDNCKKNLRHPEDDVLREYGLKVADSMIRTKARLLPNPEIMFGGNQKVNPGTSGRWDLRGKKFYEPNHKKPLKCWGVGFFKGRHAISMADVEKFCDQLVRTYQGHGGIVQATRPHIMELPADAGKACYDLFHATGNKFNQRPQLLILVVQDKQSFHYLRLKKSCDCRFGVASQVLQSQQVVKANGQYISNVLMKINAKLGGTTAKAVSRFNPTLPPYTMVIGADVSHASPGSHAPSMASFTVCMDTFGGRYMAGCETNGERREIISFANIRDILTPMVREWVMNLGKGRVPQALYYFRDGVSEGQQQHVLQREIKHIRDIFKDIAMGKEWEGKVTVVICSKRHHIRAFPDLHDKGAADRNGNPLPGTLVERDVTNPHGYDFFLYSHIALQGTSRPVHYQVLIDEIGSAPNQLQNMIYEHCYQYMRSTTSVSLFPAVYYAHLASNRARSHENVPASSGPQSGPGIKLNKPPPPKRPADPPSLMPIPENDRLHFNMWYI